MKFPERVLDELRRAVGAEHVRGDSVSLDAYGQDALEKGHSPDLVVVPATTGVRLWEQRVLRGGLLRVVLEARFSRRGGPTSAYGAYLVGLVTWAYGDYWADWGAPFLTSLVWLLVAYLGVARLTARPPIAPVNSAPGIGEGT